MSNNSPSSSSPASEAKGFLDFLDDDLLPETLMRSIHRRTSLTSLPSLSASGSAAVGFLDLIDEKTGKTDSPEITRVVAKKKPLAAPASPVMPSTDAKGFLDVAAENLDLSFPDHPMLKTAHRELINWSRIEYEAFLLCFRSWAKPLDIVNLWASRFTQCRQHPDACKLLIERMRAWVTLYPSDFGPDLVDRLREIWMFVVERPTHFKEDLNLKDALSPAMSPLNRKSSSEGRRATTDSEAQVVSLIDLQPQDIARVLTLDEFEMFAEVTPLEWIAKGGWAKGEKTPALDRLTERFNKISRWVTTSVIIADDAQKIDVLIKFILVAYYCRKLNNFNTMMEVVSGLNQSSVTLLKDLWAVVPSKIMKKWEEMSALTDPIGNFRNYRRELKAKANIENRKKAPVVPYIPVFLRDCLFFNEGNSKPDMTLLVQFWSTIEQIRRFQQVPYALSVDSKTANFICNNLVIKDEEELFRLASRSRPSIASREEFFKDVDLDN